MKWLAPTTIAELYDMSAKSLHRMIDRGELPAVVFPNGKKRVSQEALEKLLRRSSRKHGCRPSALGEVDAETGDSLTRSSAVHSSGSDRKCL